jgi:methylmalonyl-CoA mutase cobalamin-binding domain/chain
MGLDASAPKTLGVEGLKRFQQLHADAVNAVTERFYAEQGLAHERFGHDGRDRCREDIAFHLEFLRPVLEFGLLQPMVDYLCWLDGVLAARAIPVDHLALSLDWLGEYFATHMDAADAAVVTWALRAARTEYLEAGAVPAAQPKAPDPWSEAAEFEAALLDGNQRQALATVKACLDDGRGLVDVELHVIQPALYGIGEKWQANQVTVAQEHMATAIARSVMTFGLLTSTPPPLVDKRVLLACVEGNDHDVGLRMVADAFLLAGWDVQYLGASVPTAALVQQTVEWKPDLVGLSVSFAQQMRTVKHVIAQLRETLGTSRPAIMIGGLAINRFIPLAVVAGADACSADAGTAVAEANRILRG